MLNTAEKVHAGNKIATHQNHATNYNYLQDIYVMSKAQLRKQIEMMQMELNRLRSENDYYLNLSIKHQEKVLELQTKILDRYGEEYKPYMVIAK